MARTTQQIFDEIQAEALSLAQAAGNTAMINMLANTSKVAIWKLLFYAVAFTVNVLESIFDLFKADMDDMIKQLKPHSPRWYAEKAKSFQYGMTLIQESDQYDNTALTQSQIDATKIVTQAAVVEQNDSVNRGIRIKVAKTAGADLTALTAGELASFTAYMERVKDAGIKLNVTSAVADDLKADLRIFFDPLVLNGLGQRIDGTSMTPVQDAFKNYLKNLPFNGLFVPQLMIDQLQKVEGVIIVKDDSWQARYGANPFASIDVEYVPDAGYLRIDDINFSLQFLPHAII
jgi:hypothetical protein